MIVRRTFYKLFLFVVVLVGCQTDHKDNQIEMDQSSLFWFESDSDEGDDYPPNIDPEMILCYGKGLKVGRCISSKLSSGICLGLLKQHKHVIAIEVPCNVIQNDTLVSTIEQKD